MIALVVGAIAACVCALGVSEEIEAYALLVCKSSIYVRALCIASHPNPAINAGTICEERISALSVRCARGQQEDREQ